jgi:hypothetical protein
MMIGENVTISADDYASRARLNDSRWLLLTAIAEQVAKESC